MLGCVHRSNLQDAFVQFWIDARDSITTMRESRTVSETSGTITALRLRDIIALAWKGKWYLSGCVLVSLLAGAGYLMKVEPTYQVNARLLVQQEGFPLERDIQSRKDTEFLATQAEIIGSPAVVEQAAVSLEGKMPAGFGEGGVVRSILGSLLVKPVTGTNVLSISFRSHDEEFAVDTVNAIVHSYQKYLQEMDRDSNLHALDLLTESERTLRSDLEDLQAKYRRIRKNSPLMGQGAQAASVQRSLLENLGMSLSATRTRRIELENQIRVMKLSPTAHVALADKGAVITPVSAPARLQSVSSQPDDPELVDWRDSLVPNMQAEGYESLMSFRQQVALAEIRLQGLERNYGEKHPEMKAVRKEVSAWKKVLHEMVENAPKMLERDLATIELQEQRLTDLYEKEFEKAKVVDSHLLEEQQALDGIQRVQMIHDSILTQLRELQLADQALENGRSVVKVAVLEAPALKHHPIWPKKSVLLGGCLSLGLVAGMGLIAGFARASAPTTAGSSEDWQQESSESPLFV